MQIRWFFEIPTAWNIFLATNANINIALSFLGKITPLNQI